VSLNPLDWGHLLLAFVFCCSCVLFCFCSIRNGIHGLLHGQQVQYQWAISLSYTWWTYGIIPHQ
jgi:hypothetical protein